MQQRYPAFDQASLHQHSAYLNTVKALTFKLTDEIPFAPEHDSSIKYRINVKLSDLQKISLLNSPQIQSYDLVCAIVQSDEELKRASEYPVDLFRIQSHINLKFALATQCIQNQGAIELSTAQIDLDFFHNGHNVTTVSRRRNVVLSNSDSNPQELFVFGKAFFGLKKASIVNAWRRTWRSALVRKAKAKGMEAIWEEVKVV
ncbi:RNase_P subunit p30 domain-containing protein [Hexamita inflata]|uniref:RNase P subunit p30 domain-containing protein n=1 Tax=Hexamita inflata TaxID=28002 RepID=A0AA86N656_9EUKA|nr:RNase P subunit p30 domain-containing protein [Hexamita inflata]